MFEIRALYTFHIGQLSFTGVVKMGRRDFRLKPDEDGRGLTPHPTTSIFASIFY